MRRGSTPIETIYVHGIDLTGYTIFVTIKARGIEITKTGNDLHVAYADGVTAVVFSLTQEETLSLPEGSVDLQLRFINEEQKSDSTEIVKLNVGRILKEGPVAYNGRYNNE